jgi:hypothetical protein
MIQGHTPFPWFAVNYANFWNIQQTEFYENGQNILDEEECDKAKYNAVLAAMAPRMLRALSYLIEMKEHKDKIGKDEIYLIGQPMAWSEAKEIIEDLKKQYSAL